MPEGVGWDEEIEVRKQPWRVKVGDDIFEFVPELDSDLFLDAYAKIRAVRDTAIKAREGDDGMTVEQLRELNDANKGYLGMLMLPESRDSFLAKSLPSRIVMVMTQKVMEYYAAGTNSTTRPTGPSSGSSTGSSTAGPRSTGTSRSKASTRAGGRQRG